MKKIILATNNKGKINEFNSLLKNHFSFYSQEDMGIAGVPETGLSFVENALIKARNASLKSSLPAIADDSGLVVDALNGAPGVYSARYAGENASDNDNLEKLLYDLKDIDNRSAKFHCALVFVRHSNDPIPLIAQASWEGKILKKPKGENGFGYDPIFYIAKLKLTAAQLSQNEKNKISHRGKALQKLIAIIESEFNKS